MINPIAFQTCIAGLVGFRESLDATMPTISDDLKSSESGIYVNDIHSLITVENIYNCIVNTGTITLPSDWSIGTAYTVGQRVVSGGLIYLALQAGTNNAVSDATYWQNMGNPLSMYLQDKMNQSGVKLANAIYIQKNLNQQAKSILPDTMLYGGNGNIRNTITGQGRFVGFRIKLKDLDLAMIITKIGLQFNAAVTDFPIYLYNSSQSAPVKIWNVTTTSAFSFQWATLTKQIMSFLSDTTNVGTDFYLGYYETDLNGVMAINNEYTFTQNLCGPCNPVNYQLRKTWGEFIDITPFQVVSENLNADRTLWNVTQNGYTGGMYDNYMDGINWGINLLASVYCDTTDFFCRNKHGLSNAIAFQTAVSILQDMAFSARDNQQMLPLQQLANYALNNQDNNTAGLNAQMTKQIQQLDFNYAGSNPKCLPCADLYNNQVFLGSVY